MPGIRKKNKTAKRDGPRRTTHKYYSKMTYDGNILSVESKQNNQPIQRKKYTLKQLRREIPIAAELINKYLDGKVPRSLHHHNHPPHAVSIYPVLPNPVDLGLIPPAASTKMPAMPAMPAESRRVRIRIGDEFHPIPMSSDCSPSTCERGRKHRIAAYDNNDVDNNDNDNEIMKLFVSEKGDDRDDNNRKIRFI